MKPVRWPDNFAIEQLDKRHKRSSFHSGVEKVDEWLKTKARQSQEKRLSISKVLLKEPDTIVGYYTLSIGQVNFDELPQKMARKLPSNLLPILTLAWLGIDKTFQGQGLGVRLLAQALVDCHKTGKMMPFVAVLLDCVSIEAKSFYQRYDFKELPGHPMTLMLSWKLLENMMEHR